LGSAFNIGGSNAQERKKKQRKYLMQRLISEKELRRSIRRRTEKKWEIF